MMSNKRSRQHLARGVALFWLADYGFGFSHPLPLHLAMKISPSMKVMLA